MDKYSGNIKLFNNNINKAKTKIKIYNKEQRERERAIKIIYRFPGIIIYQLKQLSKFNYLENRIQQNNY